MTNQEIADLLAQAEEALFYAKNQNPELKEAHRAARAALEAFAAATRENN